MGRQQPKVSDNKEQELVAVRVLLRQIHEERVKLVKMMNEFPVLLVRTRDETYAVERIRPVGREIMAWARRDRGIEHRAAPLTVLILYTDQFTHTWREAIPGEEFTIIQTESPDI